jgi:hypothetical protein
MTGSSRSRLPLRGAVGAVGAIISYGHAYELVERPEWVFWHYRARARSALVGSLEL